MDTVGVPPHPLPVHAVLVILPLAALAGPVVTALAGRVGAVAVWEGKL